MDVIFYGSSPLDLEPNVLEILEFEEVDSSALIFPASDRQVVVETPSGFSSIEFDEVEGISVTLQDTGNDVFIEDSTGFVSLVFDEYDSAPIVFNDVGSDLVVEYSVLELALHPLSDPVSVVNNYYETGGTQVDGFLDPPEFLDEADATYFYFGWQDVDGSWLIHRQTRATGAKLAASTGYIDLNAAWPDRASLAYN